MVPALRKLPYAIRTLTLEQVYATITFYLQRQAAINQYLERWRNNAEAAWQAQRRNPSPALKRLLLLKAQQQHTEKAMA